MCPEIDSVFDASNGITVVVLVWEQLKLETDHMCRTGTRPVLRTKSAQEKPHEQAALAQRIPGAQSQPGKQVARRVM